MKNEGEVLLIFLVLLIYKSQLSQLKIAKIVPRKDTYKNENYKENERY